MGMKAWTPMRARAWLEGIQYRGMQLGMERVRSMAARLGNPEISFPSILIAGTNGKGSVAAILDSILTAAGLRTGRYTSPHLMDWTERIAVGGVPIGEEDFARSLQAVSGEAERLQTTPFETLTMAAFWHFDQVGLDLGVVEVGLGGRLDATRLCRAEVTVITAIGIDHTGELGSDLDGIAEEKGSIMRDGIPAVLGPGTEPVYGSLRSQASRTGARLVPAREMVDLEGGGDEGWAVAGRAAWTGRAAEAACAAGEPAAFEWRLPLAGEHMMGNLRTALAVIGCLRGTGMSIPTDAVVEGIGSVRWPGRLQYVSAPEGSPDLLLDVGHNPMAAQAISSEISVRAAARHKRLVVALAEDKDLEGFIGPLIGWAEGVIATRWSGARARAPQEIAEAVERLSGRLDRRIGVETAADPPAAVAAATRDLGGGGLVIVTGSHNLVGPVLRVLGEEGGRERLWPAAALSGN